MVDEARLHSPIHSACEALAVRRGSGRVVGGTGPPLLTNAKAGVVFSVHLIGLPSTVLRYNGFPGIQKAVGDQMGSRPPNRDHDFFCCKCGFGKCSRASSWFNYLAGCHQLLHKIHLSSHITIWLRNTLLPLHTVREDDTSKRQFYYFWSAPEAPT